jgi:hypothetical protein
MVKPQCGLRLSEPSTRSCHSMSPDAAAATRTKSPVRVAAWWGENTDWIRINRLWSDRVEKEERIENKIRGGYEAQTFCFHKFHGRDNGCRKSTKNVGRWRFGIPLKLTLCPKQLPSSPCREDARLSQQVLYLCAFQPFPGVDERRNRKGTRVFVLNQVRNSTEERGINTAGFPQSD